MIKPGHLGAVGIVGVALSLGVAACGGSTSQVPPRTTPGATVSSGGGASADPLDAVAQFEGTYNGSWTNTTFGSTGAASVAVGLDRANASIGLTLTLGGNAFGGSASAPETLTGRIGNGQAAFESATLGHTTIDLAVTTEAFEITLASSDVPSARIATFTATSTVKDANTIGFEYTVTFRDGTAPATGTGTLTK